MEGTWKEIEDKGTCKILGATLQANMTWAQHLEKGKKALLPTVNKQLGALKHLGRKIPPKCRKVLASGLIISRLSYLVSLLGSTTCNYLRKAQAALNKVARWMAGLERRTKVSELMRKSGLHSIREMIKYHSLMLMWKVICQEKPKHLYNKIKLMTTFRLKNKNKDCNSLQEGLDREQVYYGMI